MTMTPIRINAQKQRKFQFLKCNQFKIELRFKNIINMKLNNFKIFYYKSRNFFLFKQKIFKKMFVVVNNLAEQQAIGIVTDVFEYRTPLDNFHLCSFMCYFLCLCVRIQCNVGSKTNAKKMRYKDTSISLS